jgi:prevent-host-death family protein
MAMKTANVAELKNRLSEFLAYVEAGEEVEICKRNIPIARVVPVPAKHVNQTKIGCGKGTVKILGDLTEPQIPLTDWDMLRDDVP